MSLNGLGATDIIEAYQSALGEGGGWFLLKYATRDEVALLKRGSGGVVDIRESIALYPDLSPLYGFVHYRRRRVILKYVPEGTSRLLQGIKNSVPKIHSLHYSLTWARLARVSVHFQSITEQFSPYDTVFSFTTAKGLNDVSLSSACSLHTASASVKSSSDSLRQRGLSGIAEDASEFQPAGRDLEPTDQDKEDSVELSPLDTPTETTNRLPNAATTVDPSTIEDRASPSPTRTPRNIDKALPPTPGERTDDKATARNALEDIFLDSRPSVEGRPSVQSTRPSIRSMQSSYEYKNKVKLGPRPSLESSSGFHSQDRSGEMRPVSTLPTGVRLAARKQAPIRSKSANGRPLIMDVSTSPFPCPKSTPYIVSEKVQVQSPAALPKQLQLVESKAPAMTPEKRRLKKALELRQKQMAAKKVQQASEMEGEPQDHHDQPCSDPIKRESLTATLPDVSPADETSGDVLQERIDALNHNPALVHVRPHDMGKVMPESYEISPISIPEASDGPSTQASSVSDEDETPINAEPIIIERETGTDSLANATTHDQPIGSDTVLPTPEKPPANEKDSTADTPYADGCKACKPHSMLSVDQLCGSEEEPPILHVSHSSSVPPSHEAPNKVSSTSDPTSPISISDTDPVKMCLELNTQHKIPLPPDDEDEEASLKTQVGISDEPPVATLHFEDATHLRPDSRQFQEESEHSQTFKNLSEDAASERRERRARRHGLIDPIKRVSSPDISDELFLSDDSFMEELKSATVQEAKPISVSKSPITPVFPRSVSDSKPTEELRPSNVSSRPKRPKRQDDLPMMPKLPDLYSARSSSAPSAPLFEAQISPPTLKKVGVSSGISQRIKLLEQLSSRPTSPAPQLSSPSMGPGSSPVFSNARKTSFRASQAAAEIARSTTQTSKSRTQMHHAVQPQSPDRQSNNMSDSVVRIDVATGTGKARPESISVTARIIRGPQNKMSDVPEYPSRPRTGDLYPSPLTVEHHAMRPTSPPLSPLKPPKPRYARSSSSSSTANKSDPPRRDSISSRLSSTPSRRGSEPELAHSLSDLSINSINNLDGPKDEKKESRKSRLFKRMSSISAASRRSIVSALSPVRKDIKEEPIVEHNEPSRETIRPLVVEIGDVNIQFPDTLLWKRRHMKIDEEGLLVLAASKSDNNTKIITKRYPFTEFNPPYLPDQDQQELPNSKRLGVTHG
ncbi:MAG: hypothetical protein Q9182_004027 [Xanthomendoza sp. 2 TL-2023]